MLTQLSSLRFHSSTEGLRLSVSASHLSAPVAPHVVTLLAQPLHEFHTFRDQTEFVLGQQYVGRHLDVCGARLPGRRHARILGRPRGNAICIHTKQESIDLVLGLTSLNVTAHPDDWEK